MLPITSQLPLSNRILDSLPEIEVRRLEGVVETVPLEFRQVLHNPGQPLVHVYFPLSGIVSMLSVTDEDRAVETALVGKEGMVGLPSFFEEENSDMRSIVQVEGQALRLTTQVFRDASQQGTVLRASMNRYANLRFSALARAAACNGLHSVLQRCARWLLIARERVGADEFPMTHEFLAWMLAVRRSSVTDAARKLRQSGLIAYSPRRVQILDLEGLKLVACSCWREADTETPLFN